MVNVPVLDDPMGRKGLWKKRNKASKTHWRDAQYSLGGMILWGERASGGKGTKLLKLIGVTDRQPCSLNVGS